MLGILVLVIGISPHGVLVEKPNHNLCDEPVVLVQPVAPSVVVAPSAVPVYAQPVYSQLMQSIWLVQGYGQRQIFGNPTNSLLLSSAALDPVSVLEQLVAQSAAGDIPAQVSIPWNIILPWLLKLAVQALEAAIKD